MLDLEIVILEIKFMLKLFVLKLMDPSIFV